MITFAKIIGNIEAILKQIIELLFLVATVVFLWGVIQYVIAGGDEKKVVQAKQQIIYGLIGLFVMVALWGIVFAIYRTLFGASPVPLPTTPSSTPGWFAI